MKALDYLKDLRCHNGDEAISFVTLMDHDFPIYCAVNANMAKKLMENKESAVPERFNGLLTRSIAKLGGILEIYLTNTVSVLESSALHLLGYFRYNYSKKDWSCVILEKTAKAQLQ